MSGVGKVQHMVTKAEDRSADREKEQPEIIRFLFSFKLYINSCIKSLWLPSWLGWTSTHRLTSVEKQLQNQSNEPTKKYSESHK